MSEIPNGEAWEDAVVRHELAPAAAWVEELVLEDLRRDYPDLPDGLTVHFDLGPDPR